MDSILQSVKQILGINAELSDFTDFDNELILHINMALNVLFQLGFGKEAIVITGATEKWSDYIGSRTDVEMIKTYIAMKVKKNFDPPTSGAGMESLDSVIRELEFRINVLVDKIDEEGGSN